MQPQDARRRDVGCTGRRAEAPRSPSTLNAKQRWLEPKRHLVSAACLARGSHRQTEQRRRRDRNLASLPLDPVRATRGCVGQRGRLLFHTERCSASTHSQPPIVYLLLYRGHFSRVYAHSRTIACGISVDPPPCPSPARGEGTAQIPTSRAARKCREPLTRSILPRASESRAGGSRNARASARRPRRKRAGPACRI